ncbi:MAG: hypothetical protein C0432_05925 [Candidatus Puniceispirillum sp.]|nr:hypothetical protein [Candidatus Pelagibacter sp.]MBA4283812.1 hypothetical protein [Candidatus Puniceispirillum sp.]
MLKKISLFFTVIVLSTVLYLQFFFDASTFLNKQIQNISKSNPYFKIESTSKISLQLVPIALKISKIALTAKDKSLPIQHIDMENIKLDVPFQVLKSLVFQSTKNVDTLTSMDETKLSAFIYFALHQKKVKTQIDLSFKKKLTSLIIQTLKNSDIMLHANVSLPYGLHDWQDSTILEKVIPLKINKLAYDTHTLNSASDLNLKLGTISFKKLQINSHIDGFKPIKAQGQMGVNFHSNIPVISGEIHCQEITKLSQDKSSKISSSNSHSAQSSTATAVALPLGIVQGKINISFKKLDLKIDALKKPLSNVTATLHLSPQELWIDSFKAYCTKDLVQASIKADLNNTNMQLSLNQFDIIQNIQLKDSPLKKGLLTANLKANIATKQLLSWNEKSMQSIQANGSFDLKESMITLFDLTRFLKHLKTIKNLDGLLHITHLLDQKKDTSITECLGSWKLNPGYILNLLEIKTTIESHQIRGQGTYNGITDQIHFRTDIQPQKSYQIPNFSLMVTNTLSDPKFSIDTNELAKNLLQKASKNIVQKHLQKFLSGDKNQQKAASKKSSNKEPLEQTIKSAVQGLLHF